MSLRDSLVLRFRILLRNLFPGVTLLPGIVNAFSAPVRCAEKVRNALAFLSHAPGFLQKPAKLCSESMVAGFMAIQNAVMTLVSVPSYRAGRLADLDAAIPSLEV